MQQILARVIVGTLIGLYGYGLLTRLTAALVTLTALLVGQGLRAVRR